MDNEGPYIYTLHDKFRRARKEHVCRWCKEIIPVGSKYLSLAYTEDGQFKHDTIHLGCRYGYS